MDPEPRSFDTRLVTVGDELHASMVHDLLESHGVAGLVRRAPTGELDWGSINVGMAGAREILVASADLATARSLLAAGEVPGIETHSPTARRSQLRTGLTIVAVILVGLALLVAYALATSGELRGFVT